MKAVILVGGPSKGTRFRPLSFKLIKPLFPLCGIPMLEHHLNALEKIEEVTEVLVSGFYEEGEMNAYLYSVKGKYRYTLRYLRERQALGTAGGLYHFRDQILTGEPKSFFVLHCDVASSFPLKEMLEYHKGLKDKGAKEGYFTVLAVKTDEATSQQFGSMVINKDTNEICHYAEKPDNFISEIINGGVYLFSPEIFYDMGKIFVGRHVRRNSFGTMGRHATIDFELMRIEQDLLTPLAGSGREFAFMTDDPWCQIKTAETALIANAIYLDILSRNTNETMEGKIYKGDNAVGNVFVGPNSIIDPTAKIGPNVVIGSDCRVGPGVRIKNAIILDQVTCKDHSLITSSVVGSACRIGRWSRVQGTPGNSDFKLFADGRKNPSITSIGNNVDVGSEIIIRDCIVLPNKTLSENFHNEVLL